MDILLVEADYKNKYPPLGLMKISAYHKNIGDNVIFVKGKNKALKEKKWDKIYITTLFTFYWKKTVDTIKFYYNSVAQPDNIYVGGVLATLLKDEIEKEPGIKGVTVLSGLLNKPKMLGNELVPVDLYTPDYSIIDTSANKYLDYEYEVQNAYITSTTKGCIRKCSFCAVSILEPKYCEYLDIKNQIYEVDNLYGEKRDLMLMDNNILASDKLSNIIEDLVSLGFERDNKSFTKKQGKRILKQTRRVDFNQGIDARLLTEEKMKQLSRIELHPLRIAFDHADKENIKIYKAAQRLAAKYKIKNLSNYILFNYKDTPKELYDRLRINIKLNEEFARENLSTSIWSFPMKYMPISGEHCKDRKYVGMHWNAKMLRGVQCILNATHAVVGPKRDYFELAFGHNYDEFIELIYMPELYITKRKENAKKIAIWKALYQELSSKERIDFIEAVKDNTFPERNFESVNIQKLYKCYYK